MPQFVSVVMPIRNEVDFIAQNLATVLDQDYPSGAIEVIVADGMSDDGTREFLDNLQAEHDSLEVIDNQQRTVPSGLNDAIKKARGDIIIRIDGHVVVERDFVKQSVQALEDFPEAWAVGGPIVHAATGKFGKAVAVAMSHQLGVGNATHRLPAYEGYGEGTALPAVHRWVFDKIGFYDEELIRNQDDEFYFRIKRAGGKFFITPRIKYKYFVRERISQLFSQYYQYSFWRIPVMRKHGKPTTLRQLIPSIFYLAVAFLLILGAVLQSPWLAFGLPLIYGTILCAVGLSKIPSHGIAVAGLVPLAMATMHFAYAWGMLSGFFHALFGKDAWCPHGRARDDLSR